MATGLLVRKHRPLNWSAKSTHGIEQKTIDELLPLVGESVKRFHMICKTSKGLDFICRCDILRKLCFLIYSNGARNMYKNMNFAK